MVGSTREDGWDEFKFERVVSNSIGNYAKRSIADEREQTKDFSV